MKRLIATIVFLQCSFLHSQEPANPAGYKEANSTGNASNQTAQNDSSNQSKANVIPESEDYTIRASDLTKAAVIAGAIGGVMAAIINSIFGFLGGILSRRHENEKHIRELAAQLAIEEYKGQITYQELRAEKDHEAGQPTSFDYGGLQQKVAAMLAFAASLSRKKALRAIQASMAEQYQEDPKKFGIRAKPK